MREFKAIPLELLASVEMFITSTEESRTGISPDYIQQWKRMDDKIPDTDGIEAIKEP